MAGKEILMLAGDYCRRLRNHGAISSAVNGGAYR